MKSFTKAYRLHLTCDCGKSYFGNSRNVNKMASMHAKICLLADGGQIGKMEYTQLDIATNRNNPKILNTDKNYFGKNDINK